MTTTDDARAGRIVWTSDDRIIECHLIPRADCDYVVRVIIAGCQLSADAFPDPATAVAEVARLRKIYIG